MPRSKAVRLLAAARAAIGAAAMLSTIPSSAATPPGIGHVPEGLWSLNRERSDAMLGKDAQTLWIIKDDGDALVFVIVQYGSDGSAGVMSWSGRYDGVARPVSGNGFLMSATSQRAGQFRIAGKTPDGGSFEESCALSAGGMRLVCDGQARKGTSVRSYVDDYDRRPAMDSAPVDHSSRKMRE